MIYLSKRFASVQHAEVASPFTAFCSARLISQRRRLYQSHLSAMGMLGVRESIRINALHSCLNDFYCQLRSWLEKALDKDDEFDVSIKHQWASQFRVRAAL
jgi:hypothetical protein